MHGRSRAPRRLGTASRSPGRTGARPRPASPAGTGPGPAQRPAPPVEISPPRTKVEDGAEAYHWPGLPLDTDCPSRISKTYSLTKRAYAPAVGYRLIIQGWRIP